MEMKTKEEFFAFEKKNQKFFDDYYKKKGWKFKRIIGKENKRFNSLIEIDGKFWRFEEKVRSTDYNDLLVELVQDIATKSPGWLYYTEADYILYSMPSSFYVVTFGKLKSHIKNNGSDYDFIISKKGWGETVNIAIPWKILIDLKIAKKILKESY